MRETKSCKCLLFKNWKAIFNKKLKKEKQMKQKNLTKT